MSPFSTPPEFCTNIPSYRKPQIISPEFSGALLKATKAHISALEKTAATIRAREEKKAKKEGRIPTHKQKEDKDTKELIERAKKAKLAEERNKLIEKLLKEGELPPLPPKMGDWMKENAAVEEGGDVAGPSTEVKVNEEAPSGSTRRRTKKA